MNKEDCAAALVKLFPQKSAALDEHYADYGELLAHVFFAEEINLPLVSLLQTNEQHDLIVQYCGFVEDMCFRGDERVRNVVDVTILERLSDDVAVWRAFGTYISEKFKCYINKEVIPNNCLMTGIETL